MIPSRVIERKRDGHALSREELTEFLDGYLAGQVEEYQMAAFLMAVYFQGLSTAEADGLVNSMVHSGTVLELSDLKAPRVDKHSTGGVGDKVSLVLAPLAAELGLVVPMMSGRGLGHTTGTLDKLEAIPGFRTALSLSDFRSVLSNVGCAMIGQTPEIAPLDRRLYRLRDVTGTVPSIPLIAASIMSKKLAEGLDGLVLDVKVGPGAFIPEEGRAIRLASTMVDVAARHGVAATALLTAMDRPLGRAVGNALETGEAIQCLKGEGPADLRELVVRQAVEMVGLTERPQSAAEVRSRAERALDSGATLERFARMIDAQGGDPDVLEGGRLPTAPVRRRVTSTADGVVQRIAPKPLGEAVVDLGGGRRRFSDAIDLSVGFEVNVVVGQEVEEGQPIAVVHARTEDDAGLGARVVSAAITIGRSVDPSRPLVSHRVTAAGIESVG